MQITVYKIMYFLEENSKKFAPPTQFIQCFKNKTIFLFILLMIQKK